MRYPGWGDREGTGWGGKLHGCCPPRMSVGRHGTAPPIT